MKNIDVHMAGLRLLCFTASRRNSELALDTMSSRPWPRKKFVDGHLGSKEWVWRDNKELGIGIALSST